MARSGNDRAQVQSQKKKEVYSLNSLCCLRIQIRKTFCMVCVFLCHFYLSDFECVTNPFSINISTHDWFLKPLWQQMLIQSVTMSLPAGFTRQKPWQLTSKWMDALGSSTRNCGCGPQSPWPTEGEAISWTRWRKTASLWRNHFANLIRSILGDSNSTLKIFNICALIYTEKLSQSLWEPLYEEWGSIPYKHPSIKKLPDKCNRFSCVLETHTSQVSFWLDWYV